MTTDQRTFFSRRLKRYMILAALPVAICPLLQYLAVGPVGSGAFLWLEAFIILPAMLAVPVLGVCVFLLFVRHLRRCAFGLILFSMIWIASTFIGFKLSAKIRRDAFHGLAERSTSLVKAIRAYEARNGEPPANLSLLGPGFLQTIPGTGMAAYPHYSYETGKEAVDYYRNPWALVVSTPGGGINFDMFIYLPLQNYPKEGYGGVLERIADWAYVHE